MVSQNSDGVLEMEHLAKRFGSGEVEVVALDDVNFVAPAGQMTVVMGPSGAGKTTFLTIAGALQKPSSGTIRIDGVDITHLSEQELPHIRRAKVGFIFQSFNLLDALSARDNIRLVLESNGVRGRSAIIKAESLLETFGLFKRMHFSPRQLSGGEKQRVAIARALANNPRLVLADEPTANLDSARGREVVQLLRLIAREAGKAVVVVSHDNRAREMADRIFWLEDGRLSSTIPTT